MSRKVDPEVTGKKVLDKAVAHLTRQRHWRGDWELVDTTDVRRRVSWEEFHDRPNTRIKAVAKIVVKGEPWWIAATYESTASFAELVLFGLVGLLALPKNKPSFLVGNVDLRRDNKYSWEDDGNVRKYVSSRDDWRELNKA